MLKTNQAVECKTATIRKAIIIILLANNIHISYSIEHNNNWEIYPNLFYDDSIYGTSSDISNTNFKWLSVEEFINQIYEENEIPKIDLIKNYDTILTKEGLMVGDHLITFEILERLKNENKENINTHL